MGKVRICWVNQGGDVVERVVLPLAFGLNLDPICYPGEWVMRAWDVAAKKERLFALRDICKWTTVDERNGGGGGDRPENARTGQRAGTAAPTQQ
jgi:hypothetical protein